MMKEPKYDANGLIPAIVQDADTDKVLMLAYMNADALKMTLEKKLVTFWSRSRKELWTKGDTSGHYLNLVSYSLDCDGDAILVKATPKGPVCHTGADTCWNEENREGNVSFIGHLERVINVRFVNRDDSSYTSSLFDLGVNKIAQKVGEEAVELVIEAKDDNDDLFLGEAADLLFHYLVLLRNRGMSLSNVMEILQKRHK